MAQIIPKRDEAHLMMTAVVLAGLEGLNAKLPCPALVDDDPAEMNDQRYRTLY